MWPCDSHWKKVPGKALDQQVQISQLVWGEQVRGARNSHVASAARKKKQGHENQKGPGATGSWSYLLWLKIKDSFFPRVYTNHFLNKIWESENYK